MGLSLLLVCSRIVVVHALSIITGVALIVFALARKFKETKTTAILIVCIVAANFLVFIAISIFSLPSLLAESVPQHVMFTSLIVLILLGIRK